MVVEFAAGGQLQFFAGHHHRISGGDIAGRGADHDPRPRGSTVIKIHRPALRRQRSCRHIAAIQRQRALAIQHQRAAAGVMCPGVIDLLFWHDTSHNRLP